MEVTTTVDFALASLIIGGVVCAYLKNIWENRERSQRFVKAVKRTGGLLWRFLTSVSNTPDEDAPVHSVAALSTANIVRGGKAAQFQMFASVMCIHGVLEFQIWLFLTPDRPSGETSPAARILYILFYALLFTVAYVDRMVMKPIMPALVILLQANLLLLTTLWPVNTPAGLDANFAFALRLALCVFSLDAKHASAWSILLTVLTLLMHIWLESSASSLVVVLRSELFALLASALAHLVGEKCGLPPKPVVTKNPFNTKSIVNEALAARTLLSVACDADLELDSNFGIRTTSKRLGHALLGKLSNFHTILLGANFQCFVWEGDRKRFEEFASRGAKLYKLSKENRTEQLSTCIHVTLEETTGALFPAKLLQACREADGEVIHLIAIYKLDTSCEDVADAAADVEICPSREADKVISASSRRGGKRSSPKPSQSSEPTVSGLEPGSAQASSSEGSSSGCLGDAPGKPSSRPKDRHGAEKGKKWIHPIRYQHFEDDSADQDLSALSYSITRDSYATKDQIAAEAERQLMEDLTHKACNDAREAFQVDLLRKLTTADETKGVSLERQLLDQIAAGLYQQSGQETATAINLFSASLLQ